MLLVLSAALCWRIYQSTLVAFWFSESGYWHPCWIWLLVVLGLAVVSAQFNYWLVLLDLAIGLLGLSVGFYWFWILALVGFGSLVCWTLLVHCLIGFWSCWVNGILYKVAFGPGLLDSGSVCSVLVWFDLIGGSFDFSLFLCVDLFSWLGVQGSHSFWNHSLALCCGQLLCTAPYLPQTLVSCSSCQHRLLWMEVLHDYHLWLNVWAIEW